MAKAKASKKFCIDSVNRNALNDHMAELYDDIILDKSKRNSDAAMIARKEQLFLGQMIVIETKRVMKKVFMIAVLVFSLLIVYQPVLSGFVTRMIGRGASDILFWLIALVVVGLALVFLALLMIKKRTNNKSEMLATEIIFGSAYKTKMQQGIEDARSRR